MQTRLPNDVQAFGRTVTDRLAALCAGSFSGAQYALAAESDPSLREAAGAALDELGAFELDVRGDLDELLAAAELNRVCGAVALPYPVVERQLAVGDRWLALIAPTRSGAVLVDHLDVHQSWIGADLEGRTYSIEAVGDEARRKLAPFVRPAKATETGATESGPLITDDDVSRHLVLGSWRVLGSLESALAQVSAHVQARHQFGKPLSEFQAVRFSLADAVVNVRGLSELARFTAWRQVGADGAARRADALALRVYAADAGRAVMRTCHQLLGAVGFCDEHDVSVLDRHLQSTTRLPLTSERLLELLVASIADESFETLFTGQR